ncbi:homoserine kinase [Wenzhouxiangella sp. AB-CW3]|uniref:homoserine kinase n=1 Tax=Wenzhouxiangella sp. AB-CW3 TaxID=2771012 RepID=UPI00168A8FD0|nr:homoserine kinase [Wenzhouxiangella sp. AB-CW3]QOC23454.1 homoserine kinase [Wenzhouxiangella sp. AB-CW3]
MNARPAQATAFAPASVGNVGVGYDLLGHVIEGPGDRVTARRIEQPGVRIAAISGTVTDLPLAAEDNTAGRAVISLLEAHDRKLGVELHIEKGIPLGSGLGGSAASATAAVVAVNALLKRPLPHKALYPHALAGESVASGSLHGDNVGPQLLGGLVLATPDRLVPIPVPAGLHAAVIHPHLRINTRDARRVLDRHYDIDTIVAQQTHLSLVLAGCFRDDLGLIRAGLSDVLVEPHRMALIPGFEAVQQAALKHGAMGASISGAGPSVFAWFDARPRAEAAAGHMKQAFIAQGIEADALVSPVDAPGARLIDDENSEQQAP